MINVVTEKGSARLNTKKDVESTIHILSHHKAFLFIKLICFYSLHVGCELAESYTIF